MFLIKELFLQHLTGCYPSTIFKDIKRQVFLLFHPIQMMIRIFFGGFCSNEKIGETFYLSSLFSLCYYFTSCLFLCPCSQQRSTPNALILIHRFFPIELNTVTSGMFCDEFLIKGYCPWRNGNLAVANGGTKTIAHLSRLSFQSLD
jgi:hypothetical protein